jgi:hypothetical protein
MHAEPRVESGLSRSNFVLESFRNVQELIRFIDQKAGAILVATLDLLQKVISLFILGVGALLIVLLVYQLYYVIIEILKPRKAMNYKEDESSIFYYDHIAQMKKSDLLQKYNTSTEEVMVEEIVGQLYEVSKIMRIKTFRLKRAMEYMFVNIVLLLVYIFLTTLI